MKLKPHRQHGFTLVELLIVIGILILLSALLLPVLMKSLQKKAIVEASVTLESMAVGLLKLKEDYQYDDVLGKNEDGTLAAAWMDGNEFVKELAPKLPAWADSYSPRLNARKTAYMEFSQQRIRGATLVDPWGTPYKYRVSTRKGNGGTYEVEEIYSDGPDRRPGTDDDIRRVIREYPARETPQGGHTGP